MNVAIIETVMYNETVEKRDPFEFIKSLVPPADFPDREPAAVPENTSKALEAQLAHRPDVQDLVDRNIIKDPKVAPAIQQQREELEKRKIEDSLRHKIDHRPSPETLVEQNILKDPKIAPSLQRHQLDLERNLLQDTLEHKIQERPDPAELVEQGILTKEEVPPQ
ncbi:rpel repeat protein [Mucor ambiguus]|uniref:Rpel repeat protein n=1 Tax=Mucor ambiguus TaxID=91626 RepID=A0A0C9MJF1_9FUNG|nr:rpel repeat protein [Mucor ambiguus]